jgi:WD40 repeat protein
VAIRSARQIVLCRNAGTRRLGCNLDTQTHLRTLAVSESALSALAFSSHRNILASGSQDGEVCLVNVKAGSVFRLPRRNESRVNSLVFSPGDDLIAFKASRSRQVELWDTRKREYRRPLEMVEYGADAPTTLAFDPAGRHLLAADSILGIYLWDLKEHELPPTVVPTPAGAAAFIPGENTAFVVGGNDGIVRFWDMPTLQPTCSLAGHSDTIHEIVVAADGKVVVSAGQDGKLLVWQAASEEEVRRAGSYEH